MKDHTTQPFSSFKESNRIIIAGGNNTITVTTFAKNFKMK